MDKFRNIKTLASYFSACDTTECARKTGCQLTLDPREDLGISPENIQKLADAAKDSGIWVASSSMLKVNLEGEDGRLIRGLGFDFKFFKDAPAAFRIHRHLDKCFALTVVKDELTVSYKYNAVLPGLLRKSCYFMGGDRTWYVNIDSPAPTLIASISPSGGVMNSRDCYIGLSIGFPLTFEPVIHELIHLKWPKDFQGTEQAVDRVVKQVLGHIRPMLSSLGELQKVTKRAKEEYARVSRDFEAFNRKVGEVLAIQ